MKYLILLLVIFCTKFTAYSQSSYTQRDSVSLYKKARVTKLITNYGIFLGPGAGLTSFSTLNNKLKAAGRQSIDNILIGRLIGVSAGNELVALQLKFSRFDFVNPTRKDSVHTSYNASMFEAAMGTPIFKNNKIESLFFLGWNYAQSNLLLSSNYIPTQPSFPGLVVNPSTPYATSLYSRTHSIMTEVKTFYKIQQFGSLHFDFALHVGYIFPIPKSIMDINLNQTWLLKGANVNIGQMPNVRQDYLYVNITFGIVNRQ